MSLRLRYFTYGTLAIHCKIRPTALIRGLVIHLSFDTSVKSHKNFLLHLLQTNAFRVPLPYGTGVASRGQGIGNQGILDHIWNWFADDEKMQGNYINQYVICPNNLQLVPPRN